MSDDMKTGKLIPYLTEMFRFQAWIAMGKVASPVTGEVERDLDTARVMIDFLAELESRTEGRRSTEESRALQGALTELRLNWLDEKKKPAEPAGEQPAPAGATPDADADADADSGAGTAEAAEETAAGPGEGASEETDTAAERKPTE